MDDQSPRTARLTLAQRAEVLAVAACELHDAAPLPGGWGPDVLEDALEAMETTALALQEAAPDTAEVMLAIGRNLGRVREALGLPARGDDAFAVRAAASPAAPERPPRPRTAGGPTGRRRVGLGPNGIRLLDDSRLPPAARPARSEAPPASP